MSFERIPLFNALRFSHQTCPLFHSGGVTELAGSQINLISFWIHLAVEVNKAFVLSQGFLSAKVH